LLPLPWANSTIPRASAGILRLPSSMRGPAVTCTRLSLLSKLDDLSADLSICTISFQNMRQIYPLVRSKAVPVRVLPERWGLYGGSALSIQFIPVPQEHAYRKRLRLLSLIMIAW